MLCIIILCKKSQEIYVNSPMCYNVKKPESYDFADYAFRLEYKLPLQGFRRTVYLMLQSACVKTSMDRQAEHDSLLEK